MLSHETGLDFVGIMQKEVPIKKFFEPMGSHF